MKATVKKIKVYQTGNVSNYEVYLPAQSSVTGKYIRKRFKRKTDALACADQLNIKAAARNIAPLLNEIHLIAARYQDKLTPAQFEEALADKAQAILPSTFIHESAISVSQNRFIFHESTPMLVGLPTAIPSHHSTSVALASSTESTRTSLSGTKA
ncbi:uncharacterized protein METZ01_LOCUS511503, partial [marine metagenome]